MTPNEQKKSARGFVARWKAAEGNEQRESNSFWIELCQNVLGIANPTQHLDFERKVKGRLIDVFYEAYRDIENDLAAFPYVNGGLFEADITWR